jgi:hypothetical protein
MDEDAADDIDHLEARIEALAGAIERCRKISLAAKLTIAAGAIWLGLLLTGLTAFAPYALVAALAAIIGGIVLVGSNATTWEETAAALEQAEAMRADLIGHMQMRLVGEDTPTTH